MDKIPEDDEINHYWNRIEIEIRVRHKILNSEEIDIPDPY